MALRVWILRVLFRGMNPYDGNLLASHANGIAKKREAIAIHKENLKRKG